MEQPKCQATDTWTKKGYTNTTEYYSSVKKNDILPFAMTRMGTAGIMLSDISQTEKDKCHIISLTCGI